MKLSQDQQKKVAENMKLVGKVIKDKVHGLNQSGIYSYEDLIQIGYIGLCKAAYTDKGGCFSTYAYRLIWNEICDALIKANFQYSKEISLADAYIVEDEPFEPDTVLEINTALHIVAKRATPTVQKGIEALRYAANGYSSREIGEKMDASDGKVRMWMTRAKRFLQAQPEILALTKKEGQILVSLNEAGVLSKNMDFSFIFFAYCFFIDAFCVPSRLCSYSVNGTDIAARKFYTWYESVFGDQQRRYCNF